VVAPDFASSGSSERLQASRRLRPRSIVARGAAVEEKAKAQTMEVEQEAKKTQESAAQEEKNLFQKLEDRLVESEEWIDERFQLNLSKAKSGTIVKVVLLVMLPLAVNAALQALGVEDLKAQVFTIIALFVGVFVWVNAAFFRAFTQSDIVPKDRA